MFLSVDLGSGRACGAQFVGFDVLGWLGRMLFLCSSFDRAVGLSVCESAQDIRRSRCCFVDTLCLSLMFVNFQYILLGMEYDEVRKSVRLVQHT